MMNHEQPRSYPVATDVSRFLLGGIGTGNISIGARGQYTDFEIFGTPAKGMNSPYTFFTVSARTQEGESFVRALEGEIPPPYPRSHGFHAWEIGGLPRFRSASLSSRYPFVSVELSDPEMPVEARLEAFTPFIPLEPDDSGIPGAVLRYRVRNTSQRPLTVSVTGSFANLCDYAGRDIWTKPLFSAASVNTYVELEGLRGLSFTSPSRSPEELHYLETAFLTTEEEGVFYREYWNEGDWWDGIQDFWNDLSEDGRLDAVRPLKGRGNRMHASDVKIGSLGAEKQIPAGEEREFTFLFTWYHPNRIRSWDQLQDPKKTGRPLIRNHYARFGSALKAAQYLAGNLERLEGDSRLFSDALYGSTLPADVIEAVADTITVIRSNTCFQVEGGKFFAYEGCFDNAGCCDGNCTHVWNYAQTLAFLFPSLERSMRETEFLEETGEDGSMAFRARKFLGDEPWDFPPAADGQLGSVLRLYREWRFCGDDEWLRRLWPNAKKALEFAYQEWDSDGDGMLDNRQHNTYDIEFYGPNSLVNSIWLAALKAGAQLARRMGEEDSARRYEETAASVQKLVDDRLFQGEYYVQDLKEPDQWKYQYGTGCLSDQLLGQLLAHVNGLGYVLDPDHVKKAVSSIFRYNFKQEMHGQCNLQRAYAMNGEPGLLLCTWPHGGRPEIPFVYSDEVWTGIEYQVAAHLIYEGFVEEGMRIVSGVRSRYNGVSRSPWNEVECGHHYARSLSSWAVLLALSGYQCSMPDKAISFRPAVSRDDFCCFFSCGTGWGVLRQKKDPETGKYVQTAELLHGTLGGAQLKSE